MAENSENIEAKLCAYVEGDLDDNDRLEIERHLEANPKHRHLLTELAATRDLLRYLPREQAPPELAEAFNGQLERSVLLDSPGSDIAGADAAVLRANFLPRFFALAAVVILAVLLGLITFFALPRGPGSGRPIALPNTTPPTDGSAGMFDGFGATRAAEAPPPRTPGGSTARDTSTREELHKSTDAAGATVLDDEDEGRERSMDKADGASPTDEDGAGVRLRTSDNDFNVAGEAGADSDVATRGARTPRISKGGIAPDGPAGGGEAGKFGGGGGGRGRGGMAGMGGRGYGSSTEPVYVLVSAADLAAAVRAVETNLSTNRIEFEDAHAGDVDDNAVVQQQARRSQAGLGGARGGTFARLQLGNALSLKQNNGPRGQLQFQFRQPRGQQPAIAGDDTAAGGQRGPGAAGGIDSVAKADERPDAGKSARASRAAAGGPPGAESRFNKKEQDGAAPAPPPPAPSAAPGAGAEPEPPTPAEGSPGALAERHRQDQGAPSAEAAKPGAADADMESARAEESEDKGKYARSDPAAADVPPAPAGIDAASEGGANETDDESAPETDASEQSTGLADASTAEGEQGQARASRDALYGQQQQQQQDGLGGMPKDAFEESFRAFDAANLRCIVAYDMTPEQAVALGEALARDGRQQVEVIADQPELMSLARALETQAGVDARVEQRGVTTPAPAAAAAAPPPAPAPADDSASDAEPAPAGPAEVPADVPAEPAPAVQPPASRSPAPKSEHGAAGAAAAAGPAATPKGVGARRAASQPSRRVAQGAAGAAAGAATTTRPATPKAGVAQKAMRQGGPPAALPPRITAGERLSVTVDELAGPDTDKTVEAVVGPDGTVRLTKLPPIRVAGMTRAEAEQAIARAYRESQVVDSPTVSVERKARTAGATAGAGRPGSAPAAQGASPGVRQSAQAPAMPADAPAAEPESAPAPRAPAEEASAAPAPADRPQPPAPEPADAAGEAPVRERVNVVILVQQNAVGEAAPLNGAPGDDLTAAERETEATEDATQTDAAGDDTSDAVTEESANRVEEDVARDDDDGEDDARQRRETETLPAPSSTEPQ